MPLFISFEGPDGSGKSTQAHLLARVLQSRGLRVVETREPGGTPLGERVRDVALNPHSPPATPLALAFLMSAARAQLVAEVIAPALADGQVVISDRYADSTAAYQGFGLGVDLLDIRELTRIATGGISPDVIVYVDIPVELGLERVAARGFANRLDEQTLAFHRRVRDGYQTLARQEPRRWLVVDGAANELTVHQRVMHSLEPFLNEIMDPV
ncbi:MAG TPA: dTMP kinase [Chloroflexota bacterium]